MRLLLAPGLLIMLLSCGQAVQAAGPAISDTLLKPTAERLDSARRQQLDLLTPQSFQRAQKAFTKAGEKLERGRSLESIKDELSKANAALDKAEENRQPASIMLSNGLEARNDALQVEADEYDQRGWEKAEDLLRKAGVTLEKGSIKSAENRAAAAVDAYRELELRAIKSRYLAEAAALIAEAKEDHVDKFAPKTLAKAERLLAEAEQALNTDRYDTDRPRSLAREAKYEAIHSRYIAAVVEQEREDREVTVEDLVLQWEQPFRRIAGELDIVVNLSKGHDQPTADIVQAVNNLKAELRVTGLELDERSQQLMLAQSQAQDRAELEQQLQRQEETKARFARIEKTFAPDEAQVLRSGNDVIIRLIGLSFDVGKSEISTAGFSVLSKVQQAIQVFPDSELVVEGHTDSFGADESNQKLSQRRAEAVRSYLVTNMSLDPATIAATGYGESRPIANNESNEGRAKNRRIDLVIKPAIR